MARDRTTIIIAHRLSTVINADQIIVMDKGKIAEIGTHAELLEKNDVYAHLWSQQLNTTESSNLQTIDTKTNVLLQKQVKAYNSQSPEDDEYDEDD